jgi:hypothetical protein
MPQVPGVGLPLQQPEPSGDLALPLLERTEPLVDYPEVAAIGPRLLGAAE